MLVANIALQCTKAIEAFNPNVQHAHCDFGMLKVIMILILIGVIILILGNLERAEYLEDVCFLI